MLYWSEFMTHKYRMTVICDTIVTYRSSSNMIICFVASFPCIFDFVYINVDAKLSWQNVENMDIAFLRLNIQLIIQNILFKFVDLT